MIDEKKLIDSLKRMKKECTTLKEALFFDGIIAIVETQPKIDEWILVEERMPKENTSIFAKLKGTQKWKNIMFEKFSDEVFITYELDNGETSVSVAHTIDGTWVIQKFLNTKKKVIAWKPLPEPYKKQVEE